MDVIEHADRIRTRPRLKYDLSSYPRITELCPCVKCENHDRASNGGCGWIVCTKCGHTVHDDDDLELTAEQLWNIAWIERETK